MVSQDSPPNQASGILHQFIVSDSMAAQHHMENQHQLDAAYSNFRTSTSTYPGQLPSIHSLEERMSRSLDLLHAPPTAEGSDHMSHTRLLMDQHQALSLSLGSQMLLPHNSHSAHYVSDDYSFMGNALASSSNSLNQQSLGAVIGNSRYLKPAQSLLEELVSVGGKSVDISTEKHVGKVYGGGRRGSMSLSSELKAELCCNGLMSADKHEFQTKIANLITLLEEVEDRSEKYYHQMEEVMQSFEMVVGAGAAKSYTALALKAMSRHFGSLRDAIMSHINAEKRKLMQDFPKVSSGLAQLSLYDRECRQKRMSLQQLGIIHGQRQGAWRPIRGLPETSVAILRTWLFEHFLHPYPNDSEKLMLASQTGLSKNQVSNWFINARVRLWKPMIEEMYKEEFADSSQDSNPVASGSMTGESNTDHTDD
ncbi:PREDICTED: BEL1-like homeodomain protein 11 [Fragaria vesca subsp. vesca]|uniref:BEL1-like homeodomain protein 11 n=1 Tax=Fragaria vesca subsp. vesca TaxID=101020 RepID=UPI0002C33A06|nr:PREDICTED: BEL1-like homeodomain protein 11 [Fragaria vesca subsp. vesca]